jgi:lysozyme family protein
MSSIVPADKRTNYEKLFASCIIREAKYSEIDRITEKMVLNKARYQSVGDPLNIPWYVIAIIHCMEASLRFDTHLHNGDPLNKRTVQVPAGRPKTGNPPFTWEESAKDALIYDKLNLWTDWGIAGILYKLELFNGLGYYRQGINSPYLWSYSNHYTKGKYVQDGRYDPNAISKQCGAAVLLRRLSEQHLISLSNGHIVEQILMQGSKTKYYSGTVTNEAKELQMLLNSAGSILRVDGKAGERTSTEYFKFSNTYLSGDPRRV